MGPLVSIIIPCFNCDKFIIQTLESIKNQSFLSWECILVNDGSTDQTEKILLDISKRNPQFHLINSKNLGVSNARNIGINFSKGKFIQLLDSDDLIGPNKIEFQLNQLNSNSEIDIVYSGARYFKNSLDKLYLFGRNGLFPTVEFTEFDTDLLEVVKLRNPYVTSAPLYRRSVFNKVGLYDTNLKYLEDWDFQIRCVLENLKFQYSPFNPDVGSFIRLREGSLMDNRKEVLNAKALLFSKYPFLFESLRPLSIREIFKNKIKSYFKIEA